MQSKKGIRGLGIMLGIFTWAFLWLYNTALRYPIHRYYDMYIFQWIRKFYSIFLFWVPIPLLYIFIAIIGLVLLRFFRRVWHRKITGKDAIRSIINFAGYLYFFFYFLWGMHYFRPSLAEKLQLVTIKQDTVLLLHELEAVTDTVNKLRRQLSVDTMPLHNARQYHADAHAIAAIEQQILASWQIDAQNKIRIRKLQPEGVLMRFSTAGFYWPFIGEGHIDAGLHVLQWPFTNAHELAHGYGITDEGECNFIGLLTCIRSKDIFIQYSGWLSYWKYLYFETSRQKISSGRVNYNKLEMGVKNDLKEIRKCSDRFPDILPELRDIVYDTYLKQNNVQAGLQSYNQVIDLKLRYDRTIKR